MRSMISREITSCNKKSRNSFHSIQIILAIQSIIQFFIHCTRSFFSILFKAEATNGHLNENITKAGRDLKLLL